MERTLRQALLEGAQADRAEAAKARGLASTLSHEADRVVLYGFADQLDFRAREREQQAAALDEIGDRRIIDPGATG
jgi:hypothetical protein